jgi:hypothetical protein
VAALGEPPEESQAVDVELGVEPLAPLASHRGDDAVPTLPCPEDVGRETRADRNEADGEARGPVIGGLIHGRKVDACLSNVKEYCCTIA